jgi:hypothetical protein
MLTTEEVRDAGVSRRYRSCFLPVRFIVRRDETNGVYRR